MSKKLSAVIEMAVLLLTGLPFTTPWDILNILRGASHRWDEQQRGLALAAASLGGELKREEVSRCNPIGKDTTKQLK
ncbi:hypothetical protein M1N58_01420 [Dehalococcoidales bacterium]|nr:hypothetical protein [Dehalococcoidales bacterium]